MRPDETSIHDLVGAIYDGVADPALWQQALVQLSDATRSMGAMFIFMDRVHPMQSRYVLGRLDHDLMQVFLTHHADAPWTQAGIRTPPGTTFSIDTVVPARELIKTQFYGEILRPQQILHCGCAPLARDGERVVGLSVFRTPKIGPVESEDLRLLSLVAPHFKRAAQIAWRLGTLAVVDAAKTAALDGLDHGGLLIGAGGHVLFANRAAEAIIALRDGLTVAREGGAPGGAAGRYRAPPNLDRRDAPRLGRRNDAGDASLAGGTVPAACRSGARKLAQIHRSKAGGRDLHYCARSGGRT